MRNSYWPLAVIGGGALALAITFSITDPLNSIAFALIALVCVKALTNG